MSYVSLSVQLVKKLKTIDSIKAVYDYERKSISVSPTACVSSLGHMNAFNDTAANKRTFNGIIRLYFRIGDGEEGASEAERILRLVTDEIISMIEADVTLNGAFHWATPTEGKWLYGDKEFPVRIVEITISAKKRVLRQ